MASAEGMAILRRDHVYSYVSPRFAALVGGPDRANVGTRATAFEVELSSGRVARAVRRNEVARFDHRIDDNDRSRWTRITVVPLAEPGRDQRLALLALDVSSIHEAAQKRRHALRRLTTIDEEHRRRVSQRLHDGPIQLLSALRLRLEAAARDDAETAALLRLVRETDASLRAVLSDLEPTDEPSRAGPMIETWMAPLIEGSPVSITVSDHTHRDLDRPTTEAVFVTVYEVLDVARLIGEPRALMIELRDLPAGVEVTIRDPESSDVHELGRRRRPRSARSFVRSINGTLSVTSGEDGLVITARIPDQAAPPSSPRRPPRSEQVRHEAPATDLLLSDDEWATIADATHGGLIEVDARLRVVETDTTYAASVSRAPEELVGLTLRDMIEPQDYPRIEPHINTLVAGATTRFEWRRIDELGDQRWMQIAATPRLNADGTFDGALILTLDTTELHQAELTHTSALADLHRVGEATQRVLIKQLEAQPLLQLAALARALRSLVAARPDDVALRVILDELDAAVDSSDDLAASFGAVALDLSLGNRENALRDSLRALVEAGGTELEIRNPEITVPPPAQMLAIFRIAHEAAANAITHGGADHVIVTLVEADGGYRLDVVDDGTGAPAESLAPTPGHLGMRAMRDHCERVGGTLHVSSTLGQGVTVTAWVPGDISIELGDRRHT